MALKPLESVKFNAIVSTVNALKLANLAREAILAAVGGQIKDFESTSPYRVKLHDEAQEDGGFVTYTDTRKDFIRARQSGEAFQTLRAKVFGVPIDVKAAKDGEYEFTNEQIAEALKELAEKVLALPRQVKEAGNDDFKPVAAASTVEPVVPQDSEHPVGDEPDPSDDEREEEEEEVDEPEYEEFSN